MDFFFFQFSFSFSTGGGHAAVAGRRGWMAERSKALVLGTSLFGGVGSNPTPVIFGKEFFIKKRKKRII